MLGGRVLVFSVRAGEPAKDRDGSLGKDRELAGLKGRWCYYFYYYCVWVNGRELFGIGESG